MSDRPVEKAKLISAVREYQTKKTRRKEKRVDFTVSPPRSDDRILIRVITEPKAKSGNVGLDAVKEMSQTLDKRHYDKGILIAKQLHACIKLSNELDIVLPVFIWKEDYHSRKCIGTLEFSVEIPGEYQGEGYLP